MEASRPASFMEASGFEGVWFRVEKHRSPLPENPPDTPLRPTAYHLATETLDPKHILFQDSDWIHRVPSI